MSKLRVLSVFALALVMCLSALATSGLPDQYGTSPTLTSFLAVQPGSDAYQAGWQQAASIAAAITPSAAGVPDWNTYIQMVGRNYLPESINRFPNAFNTGFDNALEMAGIWEWNYDPQSCHIAVCQ